MTKETLLMQYQSECLSALKSVANIQKPFEKTFMDTMKLFMAIPDRINFLQLGRYGCFSEQTYRNLFEHETFDWFAFNGSIISAHIKRESANALVRTSFACRNWSSVISKALMRSFVSAMASKTSWARRPSDLRAIIKDHSFALDYRGKIVSTGYLRLIFSFLLIIVYLTTTS